MTLIERCRDETGVGHPLDLPSIADNDRCSTGTALDMDRHSPNSVRQLYESLGHRAVRSMLFGGGN